MAMNEQKKDLRRFDIKIGSRDWEKLTPDEIDEILQARIEACESAIAERGGKRPKREGFVLERIAEIGNLRIADMHAQGGKVKKNRHIRRHNKRAEKDLRRLQLMILTLRFPPANYKTDEVITDYGKLRVIVKRNYYPWRILEHAIMEIVMPIILRQLITDSVACIKGRGLHFGVKRMKKMLRLNPELKWFWKCDYKKYYQSVPHDAMEDSLRKRIKDENFYEMIRLALFSYDSGEEIEMILNDEEKKKRNANWVIHEPAVGRPRRMRNRPHNEGEMPVQRLPPVLR